MISDGIAEGAVQIAGSGLPIVLLADHQTTGGYPKIATVISADIRVMAQRRPGDVVKFQAVSVAEAQREAQRAKRELDELIIALKTGRPTLQQSVSACDIADCAVNAFDPQTWDWPIAMAC
jgi:allophanate hydrolase subunit 2